METTDSIGKWGLETFGPVRDPAAFIGRALEEMVELIEGHTQLPYSLEEFKRVSNFLKNTAICFNYKSAVEEVADIRIFLEHFNYAIGADGQEEVDKKMAINRKRRWNIDPKTGVAQHV